MENKGGQPNSRGIGREIRKLARENYGVQKRTNYGISPESASGGGDATRQAVWVEGEGTRRERQVTVCGKGWARPEPGRGRTAGRGERFGHVPPTTAIIETVETFKLLKPCPPSSRTFRSF